MKALDLTKKNQKPEHTVLDKTKNVLLAMFVFGLSGAAGGAYLMHQLDAQNEASKQTAIQAVLKTLPAAQASSPK
jgi:hypothetical protein